MDAALEDVTRTSRKHRSWDRSPAPSGMRIGYGRTRTGCVIPVWGAHQGGIVLARCGQGWTGPLGPRSRRIDCMIANVVVLVKISMSAPPSTQVYFAMTGRPRARPPVIRVS